MPYKKRKGFEDTVKSVEHDYKFKGNPIEVRKGNNDLKIKDWILKNFFTCFGFFDEDEKVEWIWLMWVFKGEIVSFLAPIVKSLVLNKVLFSYGYFVLFQLPLKKEEIFNKIGKG